MRRDLNPGPLAHKRETLHNDLFLSNFTIDFLQEKMKIWNLFIFNGGWNSYQPKISANSPVTGEFADTFGW